MNKYKFVLKPHRIHGCVLTAGKSTTALNWVTLGVIHKVRICKICIVVESTALQLKEKQ